MLILFKSGRRQEYLHENLRILSGSIGDAAETTYSRRWLDPILSREPPLVGEPALIVLSDAPYEKSQPVRFANVTTVADLDGTLSIGVALAERAESPSAEAWQRYIATVSGPREGAFLTRAGADRAFEDGLRVAIDKDERTWRKQVERLAAAPGYDRSAFLRLARIRLDGEDAPEAPPYRLQATRTYVADLQSFNPHLDAHALQDHRVTPFFDPLVVQVVMDEGDSLPADGVIQVIVEPLVEGRSSFELTVSRGATFGFGALVEWRTVAPVELSVPEPRPDEPERPRPVADVAPVMADQDAGEIAVRAYRLVLQRTTATPELRLALLDELERLAPGHGRLTEERALALFAQGDLAGAVTLLEALPPASLGPEARTAIVSGWLHAGRLPERVEHVAIADLTREDAFSRVLAASEGLAPADLVRVTRFLADSVLAEDRASAWMEAVVRRALPPRHRLEVLDTWRYVDADRAARAMEGLIDEGAVLFEDPATARLGLELGIDGHRPALSRTSALAVAEHLATREDVAGLESLLATAMKDLVRSDRRDVGEDIVRKIADVTPEEDPIDSAMDAAVSLLEDHRQVGDLDAASRLARFIVANQHRVGAGVGARVTAATTELDKALLNTETVRRFEELRRKEANLDLRERLAGLRLLLVGGKRAEWWDQVRVELGLSERSEWIESERNQAPNADRIEALLKRGQWAAVVLMVGRIGHKVSKLVTDHATSADVPILNVPRPTRESFLTMLREQWRDPAAGADAS